MFSSDIFDYFISCIGLCFEFLMMFVVKQYLYELV